MGDHNGSATKPAMADACCPDPEAPAALSPSRRALLASSAGLMAAAQMLPGFARAQGAGAADALNDAH